MASEGSLQKHGRPTDGWPRNPAVLHGGREQSGSDEVGLPLGCRAIGQVHAQFVPRANAAPGRLEACSSSLHAGWHPTESDRLCLLPRSDVVANPEGVGQCIALVLEFPFLPRPTPVRLYQDCVGMVKCQVLYRPRCPQPVACNGSPCGRKRITICILTSWPVGHFRAPQGRQHTLPPAATPSETSPSTFSSCVRNAEESPRLQTF